MIGRNLRLRIMDKYGKISIIRLRQNYQDVKR